MPNSRRFTTFVLHATAALTCSAFALTLSAQQGAGFKTEQAKDAQTFVDSIGVNTHINYFNTLYGNFDLLKQRLEESGIRHVRDGAVLQNDAYNNNVYGKWRALAAFGVKFNMCFDPRGSFKTPTPENMAKVLALAGPAVESIEGPNEFDVSRQPEWTDRVKNYQQTLYTAGKQVPAAQSIKFIGPSMAFVRNAPRVGDLTAMVTHGNLHTYASGGPPDDLYAKQAQQAIAMYGQRPLIVTETGYHNALTGQNSQRPVSELAGAKYIPRLYFQAFNAGIERTYLYEFFDHGADKDPAQMNQELHFGLVRNDGSPKPAFTALSNMIAILRDTPGGAATSGSLAYQLDGQTQSLTHTLLRKKNGVYYLALWQEVPSWDEKALKDLAVQPVELQVAFQKPFRRVNLYNPMSGTRPIQEWNKAAKLSVPVPDSVVILELMP